MFNTNGNETVALNRETDWMFVLLIAMGAGLAIVAVLGLTNLKFGAIAALTGGLLLAGASTLIGGFLGFLFGIPRSKQVQAAPAGDGLGREYLENTNLEQISDWLTKIIVGLTLVQYDKIETVVTDAGAMFGPVLLSGASQGVAQAVAVAVIIYFSIMGFLFSYLWTRIYMEGVLRRQSVQLTTELQAVLEDRKRQEADADAEAFELADSFLDAKADPDAEAFKEIEVKIAASSLLARTMIFNRARKVRRDNWRDGGNKDLVARTIPVFRGLIAAAPDKFHRNYGQLGYALVKSPEPDWPAAKAALEKAIAMRGPGRDTGSGYYEFNLAIALIKLDTNFEGGKPSDAAARERIAGLLDIGREVIDLAEEPVIADWAKLNKYKI